jgi:alpha-galactosidase
MHSTDILQSIFPGGEMPPPFSFVYAGQPSTSLLQNWARTVSPVQAQSDGRQVQTTCWQDPATGLRLTWEVTCFPDFPAVDWVLYFENAGRADTAIVEDVQALNLSLIAPRPAGASYLLHRTHGGTIDPHQFEPALVPIDDEHSQFLTSGEGRSSVQDFPFFRIDTAQGNLIIAVGWSGCWQARLECAEDEGLHIAAGMPITHFILHPGEQVRSPRILLFNLMGESIESNAQFRQVLYKYYAAKRGGQPMLPIPFCNTCFTRGGQWLNECNAENQISLIRAYAKLGLEALMTDAGWFTGGWPAGAGNWDPRKDAYPDGMAPVAAAAKECGMVYGLWFEPERVVAGTTVHREHPEWCLATRGRSDTYLLDFGRPEVQDYFFAIVKDFMALPGFAVYRQDFNMDPLPYWRDNDDPDRQGITEMKYIAGLYAYWDRLAQCWPDSLREECASGGLRIDLETIQRLQIAQKTDYWFDDDVDQAALWGASQYLPNSCIVAHIDKVDTYAFHSALASSLCLGWIADAPDFPEEAGRALLARYLQVRHLLVGAWYPLLPYSRDPESWMASQYHRPDLDEGIILAFRHAECAQDTIQVILHGLDPQVEYEVKSDRNGIVHRAKGASLMKGFNITILEPRQSDLVHYQRVEIEQSRKPHRKYAKSAK